ncbi:MAG: siphovirus Gp157 family protein [Methylococcales bacterium]|nr:siphovirus Gp157 family protein [Methylococcales bacterium]
MNNLSLYQLSGNYLQALDFLTDPEADLPAEVINDTLEALGGELEDKAINVAKFLRNMETTAEAIKAAEESMAKRRKALEARVKWMKDYLKGNMEYTGIIKIECPYFKLSIQNNPVAVNVTNENAIPKQFKEQVITWKIDKTAIKAAIKNGEDVPGAELVNGTRLVIK